MSVVFLDLRTLSLVLMLIMVFLGSIMLFIWRFSKTYSGFSLWATANLLIAVGFLFLSLRGIIPNSFSIIIGNTLACGSLLIISEGNRRFIGIHSRKLLNYNLFILLALALLYFTCLDNNVVLRIVCTCLFSIIISGQNAFAFLYNRLEKTSPTYKFAGATYIIFGLLMIIRTVLTLLFSNLNDLYTPDWIQSIVFLTFIFFAILWTFTCLLLNNERLQNELKKTQIELEKIAATDFLTGINNDRRFFEIGTTEIQRARRLRDPLTVIMFDLDHFKQINDTYGHAAGDRVLVEITGICRKNLRSIDVLGRLGGEEFAVLLSHTDINGGKIVAEHLRSIIEKIEIQFSDEIIKITASFGVAELCRTDIQIKTMLDRADTALYQAKNKGRNQVVADSAKKNYKGLSIA